MGRRITTTTAADGTSSDDESTAEAKTLEKTIKEHIEKGDKLLGDGSYEAAHGQYADALKGFSKHKDDSKLKPLYRKAWIQKSLALQGLRIVSKRHQTSQYLDALREALRMANSLQE